MKEEGKEGIGPVRALVNQQAEDEGLWFEAKTAPEAYLQAELRKLHAVIEAEGPHPLPLPSLACDHSFEFSSDIDEPEMKCDKCGEPLEIVSSIELRRLREKGTGAP